MANHKRYPKNQTIPVTKKFGAFLKLKKGDIADTFKNESYRTHGNELNDIYNNYDFDSIQQVLSYLLGTEKFKIVEPYYFMQVLDDNDLVVNRDLNNGDVFLDTISEFDNNFESLFTQEEIDEDPILKKFEPWKKPRTYYTNAFEEQEVFPQLPILDK